MHTFYKCEVHGTSEPLNHAWMGATWWHWSNGTLYWHFLSSYSFIAKSLSIWSPGSTNGLVMYPISTKTNLISSWSLPLITPMGLQDTLLSTEVEECWFTILLTTGHSILRLPPQLIMTLCCSLSQKALVMLECVLGKSFCIFSLLQFILTCFGNIFEVCLARGSY